MELEVISVLKSDTERRGYTMYTYVIAMICEILLIPARLVLAL
ncbi:uncharacterized protein G2W53_027989 [Senna tora]|uniref:Uncharacterized protein n=1 Tax=Senna tora TaxID=362788 RepID=A0A834T3L7_9FABA|nr:uncharacterized protein G2W53_027989 [Senna tora]